MKKLIMISIILISILVGCAPAPPEVPPFTMLDGQRISNPFEIVPEGVTKIALVYGVSWCSACKDYYPRFNEFANDNDIFWIAVYTDASKFDAEELALIIDAPILYAGRIPVPDVARGWPHTQSFVLTEKGWEPRCNRTGSLPDGELNLFKNTCFKETG
jgi:thiol-disulfide isomerase/thioredoxin